VHDLVGEDPAGGDVVTELKPPGKTTMW